MQVQSYIIASARSADKSQEALELAAMLVRSVTNCGRIIIATYTREAITVSSVHQIQTSSGSWKSMTQHFIVSTSDTIKILKISRQIVFAIQTRW